MSRSEVPPEHLEALLKGDRTVPEEIGSYRPALVALTRDLRELREELLAGFPRRRDVLDWVQRLTVRSLGELPQRYYREIGRQFRVERVGEERFQGVLLAALLEPKARSRDLVDVFRDGEGAIRLDGEPADLSAAELEEEIVTRLRERLVTRLLRPAYDRAYRELRPDATEYADESDEGDVHDPREQKHPSMRPTLGELDSWQNLALSQLLEGFDDRQEVIEWGDIVELATAGSINRIEATRDHDRDFIERVYMERSARSILLGDDLEHRRGREILAATHLAPAFNLGVREIFGSTGEVPDAARDPTEAKQL